MLSFVLVSVILTQAPQHVGAFSDHAKVMIVEVAKRYLSESALMKYETALRCDNGGDEEAHAPFSTLAIAAVWLDRQRCGLNVQGTQCRGVPLDHTYGTGIFDIWSVSKQPYDPEGLGDQLPVRARIGDSPPNRRQPTGITVLDQISKTMANRPTGSYTWGFHVRTMLSIFGALHNPTHTVDLHLPGLLDGDNGGALIRIENTTSGSGETLQEVWAHCAGSCMKEWPLGDLSEQVRNLVAEFPPAMFISKEEPSQGRLRDSWDNESASWGVPGSTGGRTNWLVHMVEDTRQFKEFIYEEYLASLPETREKWPGFSPSPQYLGKVSRTTLEQIALAGYRLSSWLDFHAQFIPLSLCDQADVELADEPSVNLITRVLIGCFTGCILGIFVTGIVRA